jgi:hypothetical protein
MRSWQIRLWNNIIPVAGRVFAKGAFTPSASQEILIIVRFANQRKWAKQMKKMLKK